MNTIFGHTELSKKPSIPPEHKVSKIKIFSESIKVTPEYLSTLNLPLSDFKIEYDPHTKERYISGKLLQSDDVLWYKHIKTYNSSYAPTSYIVPLWNETNDIIIINFTLLYTLSIIVRYLPELWYRITLGDLNYIGSLIEYYISIIDHILPHEMLQRIVGKDIYIHQPGSLYFEIVYLVKLKFLYTLKFI